MTLLANLLQLGYNKIIAAIQNYCKTLLCSKNKNRREQQYESLHLLSAGEGKSAHYEL